MPEKLTVNDLLIAFSGSRDDHPGRRGRGGPRPRRGTGGKTPRFRAAKHAYREACRTFTDLRTARHVRRRAA